jgi:4-oxalocrotonate tautomerase
MPHVSIKLYPGRTKAQKLALTERIVQAMGETIGARPETISVSFEEVSAEDWDEQVVKPDIADKLDCVVKLPGYRSKYLERQSDKEKENG